MLLGWLAAAALGCGGMFGPVDAMVFSDAQQAIFEAGAGQTSVDYLVSTGGELADWAWVVPIPGAFVGLEESDPDRFEELGWQTAIEPNYHSDPESRGCGPAAKGGDNALRSGGTQGSLTIVETGTAGVFDYTVLAANDALALLTWLDENGFDVGPSGPSIDAYVADGVWQFVAVQLNADAAPGADGVVRTAAKITYEGGRMVFPSRMSRYSTTDEQRTTVYVIGDQRATASGWAIEAFPDFSGLAEDFDYAATIAAASDDQPTAVETWADGYEGDFLTRFDIAAPSAMHDADLELALIGGTIAFHPEVDLYESEEAMEEGKGCSVVGGAAVGFWWLAAVAVRRRRES